MQTLEKFLAGSDVSMRCREVPVHADHDLLIDQPWPLKQYACELYGSNGHRPVRTIVGSDNGPPEIVEVLDAVAAEAAVAEEADGFEAWADQMGYDRDSRRGERAFRAERRQAKLLRELLGEESFCRLLWETERL
jgi:hypothetical protein